MPNVNSSSIGICGFNGLPKTHSCPQRSKQRLV